MRLIAIFALAFGVFTQSCGPLSNEEIKNLENRLNPGNDSANRTVTPVLSAIQYNSTGSEDFQYTLSYDAKLRVIQIRVSRRNSIPLNTIISLERTQQRDLYDILILAFEGKSNPTDSLTCLNCTKTVKIDLFKLSGVATSFLHPTWIAQAPNSSSAINVIDSLNTFVLNRL